MDQPKPSVRVSVLISAGAALLSILWLKGFVVWLTDPRPMGNDATLIGLFVYVFLYWSLVGISAGLGVRAARTGCLDARLAFVAISLVLACSALLTAYVIPRAQFSTNWQYFAQFEFCLSALPLIGLGLAFRYLLRPL